MGDSGLPGLRHPEAVEQLRGVCAACDLLAPAADGCSLDCAAVRRARFAARLLRGDCPLGRWPRSVQDIHRDRLPVEGESPEGSAEHDATEGVGSPEPH